MFDRVTQHQSATWQNQTIAPSETALQPFEQFSIESWREIAVIDPENSRPSLNQSDAKLKPLTTLSPTFSRAVSSLVGFTMGSHWLLKLFSFLLIGLRQLTDKRSMEQRIWDANLPCSSDISLSVYLPSALNTIKVNKNALITFKAIANQYQFLQIH